MKNRGLGWVVDHCGFVFERRLSPVMWPPDLGITESGYTATIADISTLTGLGVNPMKCVDAIDEPNLTSITCCVEGTGTGGVGITTGRGDGDIV
jgi:hypothetical protein